MLTDAGLPTSSGNLQNIARWMTAEEPTNNWFHANNPLNINAHGFGFDTFPDLLTAAKVTASVVRQKNMSGIYKALAAQADPNSFSAAVVASPWAESHYGGNPGHIAQIPVPSAIPAPGSGPTPGPTPTPPPNTPGGDVFLPTIQNGASGGYVRTAQFILRDKGNQTMATDGNFGSSTEAAVKAVQAFFGETADGIVGPITWALLLGI